MGASERVASAPAKAAPLLLSATKTPVPQAQGAAPMGREQYRLQALEQIRQSANGLERQIDTLKYRRNDQAETNDKQWFVAGVSEGVGSAANALKGKGLHWQSLPENTVWGRAEYLLGVVRIQLRSEDVLGAARALADLAEEYTRVYTELMDYIESLLGGAELATKGLEVAVVAGAVAATIATGGIASAGGAGLLSTSLAVGGVAGVYGAAQEGATQGGEMIAGSRESFDFKAIALRGGKDAIMGFVGTLAGGAMSKYAANYFGRLVMQRMKPDQIAAVAERLGVDATKLTAPLFLSKLQTFVVDFFAGAAVTPLTTAVETVLSRLEGGKVQTPEEFVKLVIKNAVEGGLMQLFLAPLLHGPSRRAKKAERTVSLGEPVPEGQLQSVQETTADLQNSAEVRGAPEPIELTATPEPFEVQSAGDATADAQTQNWAERPDAIDLPEAGPLELQNVAEGTRDAQVRAGEVVGVEPVVKPPAPEVTPTTAAQPQTAKTPKKAKASKKAKAAKKAKAPAADAFVVEQTSQGTQKKVKAGSLLKKGAVQSNAVKGAKQRKTAKRKEQTAEQKSSERERRLEDTYKWEERRAEPDELRRNAPKPKTKGPKLKAGDPDPAFPGQKVNAVHEDHLLAANKIRQIEGFAKLDVDTQNALLNTPENLVMVSEAANTSRGDTPYSEYKGSKKLGIDADPAWVKQMAGLEAQVEALIRERIRSALQARLNANWNTRLGMPEGYEGR
ncbi:MAG: hypothetical protein ABI769_07685 [Pseudomonadota bacterium]